MSQWILRFFVACDSDGGGFQRLLPPERGAICHLLEILVLDPPLFC